jgi:methylated-DNA-protein-cysteine methyltransferase-like protein
VILIPNEFSLNCIKLIQNIPKGRVLTYGRIAKLAGSPRAARQVSWLLHSSTDKYDLPWHRVVNSKGIIALKSNEFKERQKNLLMDEGINFHKNYKIDLSKYLWKIESIEDIEDTEE